MSESKTLEQEVLEEEKKGSIFDTEHFNYVYEQLRTTGETSDYNEISSLLNEHFVGFIQKKHPEQEIPRDIVETAFYAATAIHLAYEVLKSGEAALETIKNDAYKRIIRKDNFIGFNVLFENGQRGGVIIPKEQYDYINEKGLDLISMLNKEVPEERKVKEYSLMEAEELSKMLEKSADKILKGEVNE